MLSHLRNLKGKLWRYKACLNCGDRWNWKKPHYIRYEDEGEASGAMSPLCEECFYSLPVEAIMDFCNQVLTPWIAYQRTKFPQERVSNMLGFMRGFIEAELESRRAAEVESTAEVVIKVVFFTDGGAQVTFSSKNAHFNHIVCASEFMIWVVSRRSGKSFRRSLRLLAKGAKNYYANAVIRSAFSGRKKSKPKRDNESGNRDPIRIR